MEQRLAKRKVEVDEEKPLITIFGGSQGAKTLTEAAEKNCNRWSNMGMQVVCVTGPTNYVPAEESQLNCKFIRFVDDMGALLSATDVLVARSGAGSIAEIAEARCPTILVPLPSAADDHQRWNANAFAQAGCAEVLEEVDLSLLGERVQMLIQDLKQRKNLQIAMEQWSLRNRVGSKVRDGAIETKEQVVLKRKRKQILLIGGCGMGVGPLGMFLSQMGHDVYSYDDYPDSRIEKRLEAQGIQILRHLHGKKDFDEIVVTRAIQYTPERLKRFKKRYPKAKIWFRGDFLASIANKFKSVVVAGTHGKTSTTALVVGMLKALNFPCSYVMGGFFDENAVKAAHYDEHSSWLVFGGGRK